MKTINFFLLLLLVTFVSCDKSKDVAPKLIGKYTIVSSEFKIKIVDKELDDNTNDYKDENVYFEFKANGTFTTNSDLNPFDLREGEGEISGKYEYKNNELKMTYFEEIIQLDIPYTFKVKSIDEKSLALSMNKEDIFKTFDQVKAQADKETADFIDLTKNSIETFEITYNFSKP